MRIGQRANLLRAAAKALAPYARHTADCQGVIDEHRCHCGWLDVRHQVTAALSLDVQTRDPADVRREPSPMFLLRRERRKLDTGAQRPGAIG